MSESLRGCILAILCWWKYGWFIASFAVSRSWKEKEKKMVHVSQQLQGIFSSWFILHKEHSLCTWWSYRRRPSRRSNAYCEQRCALSSFMNAFQALGLKLWAVRTSCGLRSRSYFCAYSKNFWDPKSWTILTSWSLLSCPRKKGSFWKIYRKIKRKRSQRAC